MLNKIIIDTLSKDCICNIRELLCCELCNVVKHDRDIIILCIGTDRSTGDSLGPLVGDKLKFLNRDKVFVYGNLENPVHAKNLASTCDYIFNNHNNPFIIAVDAALGSLQNVGKIIIDSKPLTPGAALNKNLPQIGDLSITGIVNISGSLEFMVLQNTRLYTVMSLAEAISSGIYHSIIKTIGSKKHSSLTNNLSSLLNDLEIQ